MGSRSAHGAARVGVPCGSTRIERVRDRLTRPTVEATALKARGTNPTRSPARGAELKAQGTNSTGHPPKPPRPNTRGPARPSHPPNGSEPDPCGYSGQEGKRLGPKDAAQPDLPRLAPLVQLFLLFPDPGCSCGWWCRVKGGRPQGVHREATRRRSALDAAPPTVTTIAGPGQSNQPTQNDGADSPGHQPGRNCDARGQDTSQRKTTALKTSHAANVGLSLLD
jgi:hypothetical protein